MTGRGNPVTAPELNELLAGLFQGLEQGSHQPCGLGVVPPAESIEDTPHQCLYRLRENYCLQDHSTHHGKLKRTFWGCTRLTMGCLGEESRTGRNEYEKTEKKEDKRSWTYVSRLLVSTLVLKDSTGGGLCLGSIPGGGWLWCAQGHRQPIYANGHQEMEKHTKVIEARTGKQQQIRKQVGLLSMRYCVTSPTRKDMEGYWGNRRGLKNYPGEAEPMTLLQGAGLYL